MGTISGPHRRQSNQILAVPIGVGTPRRNTTGPLILKVLPFPAAALPLSSSRPLAVIFIGEPDGLAIGLEKLLGQLYGLTLAEARLGEALFTGDTLQEYADRQGIRVNTARVYMKHVLAKTGTRRQAELIGELMRNPVLRMTSK